MKTPVAFRLLGLAAVASFSLTTHVWATTVGLNPNTSGSYGIWDTFTANTFAGRAPDSGAAIGTPTLNVTSNSLVLGGGDRLYLNGAPSSWTANGTTSFAVKSFEVELKNYNFTSQSLTSFFTANLTIGGVAYSPDSTTTSVVSENGVNDEILKWTWSASLAANTGTGFSVNFANANGANISVDGFDVAVRPTAVPEPASIVGAALGWMAVFGTVRRFRA